MHLSRFVLVAPVLATVLSVQALAQPAAQTRAAPPPAPAATPRPAAGGAQNRNPLAFAAHVAATVNDEVISTYDLQQRMLLLIVTSGVQPTEQNAPQLQREALRGMIDERLQLQEIRRIQTKQKMKIEPTDKEIDDELTDLARGNNLRLEQLAQQLASAGVSINTLRDQIRAQVAWRRYMGGRFGSSIRIGDEQIKASLARINASAAKPQFLVSEIFLDAQRVGGAEVALSGSKQLLEQLQQGAPFPAVARQFSSAASAPQGGDEGWLVSGDIAPPLQSALEGLAPGQLSQPIETPEGVYVLLLRDRRAGSSSTMVNLKQALAPLAPGAPADQVDAATARLETLSGKLKGCEDLEAQAAKVGGLKAGETGEVDIKDLAPAFTKAVATLKPGQLSPVIHTSQGLHLVAVCSKRQGGAHEPSHAEIENRLYGEELSMLSKRFLRDLHNSATIEAR
jgi:peptidyl-prolyl cis-trans isomerase SurA